jgi:UDP-N-acetylglucosamine--N-acetylmuramyl-(pentapeptide) pyrophosphoryl-undecaprenol N-acetylglucosamine transferase
LRKIYLPIFGSGLGHVTRIQTLVNQMRRENEQYLYSTFDEAYEFLKKFREPVVRSPSVDLIWNDAGGFSSRDSFVRFPLSILKFSRQVAFEVSQISNFDPDVVVCDSRLSGVLAGKIRDKPIVIVLNQFKILFPPRFRGNLMSRFYERIEGDVLGLLWTLSDRVIMPDLPPPYTIGEANVTGCDLASRINYVGFMMQKVDLPRSRLDHARSQLGLDGRPLVFIQISGPRATKQRFEQVALESTANLSRFCNVVISLGNPQGSTEPKKLSNNSWVYEWCPLKDELFQLASLVVTRAGHNTISQCIISGKPAVYVPIFNQSEQIWNSIKCEKLGIGRHVRSENLDKENLVNSIESCLNDASLQKNIDSLSQVACKYNGVERASQIIRAFL